MSAVCSQAQPEVICLSLPFHGLTQVFEILRERCGRQGDPWELLDTTVCLLKPGRFCVGLEP